MEKEGNELRNSTDDQLMTAVQRGNSNELGFLFERYQKPLYNFFLKLTGNRNAADDLIQDTFFKVMNYRHHYREGSNFRAWIYTIAYNLYKDHIRKHKVTLNIEEIADDLAAPNGTDQNILIREEKILVRRALDKLKGNKKQALVMSRFQDLRYEEISQILGISESAVKVTVFRALKELKANYLKLAGEAS